MCHPKRLVITLQDGVYLKAVFHLWKSWCRWCHITESSLYIDHSWSKQIVHKVYPLCTIHRYCTVKWRCRKKETDGLHTLIHCTTYTANDTTPVSLARLCVLGLSSSAELHSAVAPHWSVRKLGHFLEHRVAAVYFLPAHRELLDLLESKQSNQSNHVCNRQSVINTHLMPWFTSRCERTRWIWTSLSSSLFFICYITQHENNSM